MVLRPEAMRAVEAAAVKAGVSEPALMENAGAAAAAVIAGLGEARPTIVLCGPGANGGDGYVVARKLRAAGWPVRVYAADPARARQGDAAAALMARGWDGEIAPLAGVDFDGAGLIVDALFGIGLSRTLTGPFAAAFGAVNRSAVPTVALDIPSGVDAATGRALGDDVVRAAATVAFGARKPGHLLFPGRALCGRVTVVDIGLPSAAQAAAPVGPF